jgi:hypothetical protein
MALTFKPCFPSERWGIITFKPLGAKELLVRNKLATGRPQDLADVERIGSKK